MLQLVGKRLVQMILIMITVSVLLFLSFEADKLNVASKVLSQYSTLDQRLIWLEQNGYNRPLPVRYFEWVWNAMRGDFGESIQFATPVSKLLKEHLLNTAVLGGLVLLVLGWPLLREAGWTSILVLGLLTGAALAIGHLMGGPDPEDRTALATACATRHLGIAVLVAATVPGQRTSVLVIAYLVASFLASIPYVRWRKRYHTAAAETG